MHIGGPNEIIGGEMIEVGDVLHHIVPDGASAGNTDHIVHDTVIAVAGPDPYGDMGSVAHGPVIAETLGCPCFGGSWAIL